MQSKHALDFEGETAPFKSIIGVKQGDLLGPVLFNYHMAAVMIAWRGRFKGDHPRFHTAYDGQLTGRKCKCGDAKPEVVENATNTAPPARRPRRA